MAWPDWPDPLRFYDRSTALVRGAGYPTTRCGLQLVYHWRLLRRSSSGG